MDGQYSELRARIASLGMTQTSRRNARAAGLDGSE
jgi:hypothetical protein